MEQSFRIDFIGIGSAKSGTTWLADNLRKHPQIFIPAKKELAYFNQTLPYRPDIFNYRYEKPISWYHSFFSTAKTDQIKGEFSPHYFSSKEAVGKIYKYNPEIKLLTILRNPIEAAVSAYWYSIQIGEIKAIPFEKAIQKYPIIMNFGIYYTYLKRYYNVFPKKNIKVVLYDYVKTSPEILYKEILNFLGVDDFFPDSLCEMSNKTKQTKYPFLNFAITYCKNFLHLHHLYWIRHLLKYSGITSTAEYVRDYLNVQHIDCNATTINPELTEMLLDFYLKDIHALSKLIDKDLSVWIER